jgi:phosphotriesterase-related protein
MASVSTVAGPVDTSELGFTLMHEHILVRSPGVIENFPSVWDRQAEIERAVERLSGVKSRGIGTMVDLTTADQGRDVTFVEEVVRRSGMRVIVATGIYLDVPRYFHTRSADVMAELFVGDIRDGIAGTGIKAGIIKCATESAGIIPVLDKALRAAARAHRATGVPISTHTHAASEVGTAQQDLFESEGVDLSRVVIGHSGDTTDIDYLTRLIGRGSYIGMDRFGLDFFLPTAERVATIASLCEMGHADRMVLSQDAHSYFDWSDQATIEKNAPNWRYTYVVDDVIRALKQAGVSEEHIHQMTVENPRRIFERVGPY